MHTFVTSGVTFGAWVGRHVRTLLSPERCAACDQPSPASPSFREFCDPCAATVRRSTRVEAFHYSPFAYAGALGRALTEMKYNARPDLAGPLTRMVLREWDTHSWRPDVVVPVPLHPRRLVARGFNQAALIGRPVAHALRASFAPLALARVRDTLRQAELDRIGRKSNVRGAFAVRQAHAIRGRVVLLVDDVRTTGSTLAECQRALFEGGACEVRSLVVASVDEIIG